MLRWQSASLEAGGVGRLRAALTIGRFIGGRCGFVERCVIAATAGICRAGRMPKNRRIKSMTAVLSVFVYLHV